MIAVQRRSRRTEAMNPKPCFSKTKKRSINTEPMLTYSTGVPIGPPQIQGIEDTEDDVQLAKKNLVWLMALMSRNLFY
jgi:hypothetical protein